MYSSVLSLTSGLDSGGWIMPRSGRFTPMTLYPLYRRLGRPQVHSGPVRETWPPPGLDPRTVQPIASRYTDCVSQAHNRALLRAAF